MKTKQLSSVCGRIPAGKYWFGDPCYIFGKTSKYTDSLWMKVVSALYPSCSTLDAEGDNLLVCPGTASSGPVYVELNSGAWAIIAETRYGDGVYKHIATDVGVDAGVLAIMTQKFVADSQVGNYSEIYAHFELEEPSRIQVRDGDWYYGRKLVCQTSDDE